MQEQIFEVLPSWRLRRMAAVGLGALALAAGAYSALSGQGWAWWLFAAVMLGLVAYNLAGLMRQPYVAKVSAAGVSVCYATGRVVHAKWGEIDAHTITPGSRLGALLLRAGAGGGARIVPVSTRLIGPEATERFLAALKQRLPKLEYRVPQMGGARVKKDS